MALGNLYGSECALSHRKDLYPSLCHNPLSERRRGGELDGVAKAGAPADSLVLRLRLDPFVPLYSNPKQSP